MPELHMLAEIAGDLHCCASAIGAASPIYPGRAVTLQLHAQPVSVTRSCPVMMTNTGDGLEVIGSTTTRNASLPLLTYSPRPASLYPVSPHDLP
jgi:hypothetical protein